MREKIWRNYNGQIYGGIIIGTNKWKTIIGANKWRDYNQDKYMEKL